VDGPAIPSSSFPSPQYLFFTYYTPLLLSIPPLPFPPLPALRSIGPLNPVRGSGKRCKLPSGLWGGLPSGVWDGAPAGIEFVAF